MERREIEFDLNNKDLWITFYYKDWTDEDYDIIKYFDEDDTHYILHNWLYEYRIDKEIVKEKKFCELCIECWECGKLCKLSEKVNGKWVHYSWWKHELKRDRDFCSSECLDKYVNNPENCFTLTE